MSDADKDDRVIGLIDLIDITKYLLDYRQEHGTANFEQALKSVKVAELISKGPCFSAHHRQTTVA